MAQSPPKIRKTMANTVSEDMTQQLTFTIGCNFIKSETNFSASQLIEKILLTKIVLIVGLAGTGKSTAIKYLARKLKKLNKTHWVEKIDAAAIAAVLERRQLRLQSIDKQEILEILIEILKISDGVDKQIFKKSFNDDKLVIFIDSVDQLATTSLAHFIDLLSNSNIKVCIASRPQHAKELSEKLNTVAYNLQPLSEKQVEDFIRQTLELNAITSRTIINGEDINDIIKRTKVMTCDFKHISNVFLLKAVVDTAVKVKDSKLNLFEVYASVVEEKLSILEVSDDDRESIYRTHQIFSVGHLSADDFQLESDDNVQQLVETINLLGLLSINDFGMESETVEFMHKTVAEFFIATFIIESMTCDEIDKSELMKLLVLVVDNASIVRFILDGMAVNNGEIAFNDEYAEYFKGQDYKSQVRNHLKIYFDQPKKVTGLPPALSNLMKIFKSNKMIVSELITLDDVNILKYYIQNCPKIEAILGVIEELELIYSDKWIEMITKHSDLTIDTPKDLMTCGHNYETKEKLDQPNFIRLFMLLTIIGASSCRHFMSMHLGKILNFAFRSSELTAKLLAIFNQFEPHEVVEVVKNGLAATHFHNYSLFYAFPQPFIANYSLFWEELESKLGGLIKTVLTHDFKDSPLVLALRYDIKALLGMYAKYSNECREMLLAQSQSLVEHLEEVESEASVANVGNFLRLIFKSDSEEVQKLLTTEFSEESVNIMSYLERAIDGYGRRNETERVKIVKRLLGMFRELGGGAAFIESDIKLRNVIRVRPDEKRALGVKYFSSVTVMPVKHSKRAVNYAFKAPTFVVDP